MEQQSIIISNSDAAGTVYSTPEGHFVMAVPIEDEPGGTQSIINMPLILTTDVGGSIQLESLEQGTVSIEDANALNTHNLVIRTPLKKQPIYPPGAQVSTKKFLAKIKRVIL